MTTLFPDDLDLSPDFFEYFAALRPILQLDNSLWCISAWNDNGKPDLIDTSQHGTLLLPPHLLSV